MADLIEVNQNMRVGAATINGLIAAPILADAIVVNQNMQVGNATINGLTVADISAQAILVSGTITAGNYLVSSSKEIRKISPTLAAKKRWKL